MPGNAQTPDQVKTDVAYPNKAGDDGPWFDTTAFAPVTAVRFGTVGRNTMRGPGVVNVDLSAFRTFKITEKVNVQFRAESFNLSNTPHFANPNGNVNSSNFGKIFSTQSGGDAIGRSREYRFGLRIEAASFLRVAISRSADTVLSRIIRIRSYILVSLHAVSAGKTFILTNRTKREHRVKLLASGTKIQMKAASTARLTPRTLFFAVRGYIFR